ncbi:hypothetical protein [Niallia sp. Krafla_26]|uniref:hypothetical protein n=1 Tax=Niallia sp. Krafla_26 TaxID=3064703 RepID=UPI003D17786E
MEDEKRVIKVKDLVIHADTVKIINKHTRHESDIEHGTNRRGPWRGPWDMFWGFREESLEHEHEHEQEHEHEHESESN